MRKEAHQCGQCGNPVTLMKVSKLSRLKRSSDNSVFLVGEGDFLVRICWLIIKRL